MERSFAAGDLKPSDLINRYGDAVNTQQARAIAEARRLGKDPKRPLAALARLQQRGVSGRTFEHVRSLAQQRVLELGEPTQKAIENALRSTPRRGLVTARSRGGGSGTAGQAAAEMAKLRSVRPIPQAEQAAQRRLEGRPFDKIPLRGNPAPKGTAPPAAVAPDLVDEAEREIAKRTTERSVLLRADGSMVGTREGTPDGTAVARGQAKGGVLIHNHPVLERETGPWSERREWLNPPSLADLNQLLIRQLAEVRAVVPSGGVYSVLPGPNFPTTLGRLENLLLQAKIAAYQSKSGRSVGAMAEKYGIPAKSVYLIEQELALRYLHQRGIIVYRRGRHGR